MRQATRVFMMVRECRDEEDGVRIDGILIGKLQAPDLENRTPGPQAKLFDDVWVRYFSKILLQFIRALRGQFYEESVSRVF